MSKQTPATERDLALARVRAACHRSVAARASDDIAETIAHAAAEYEDYFVTWEPSVATEPEVVRAMAIAKVVSHLGVTNELIDAMKATLAAERGKHIGRQ